MDKKIKILAVDDDSHIRDIIFVYLDSLGYEVDIAVSGEEALELFDENEYDLVITDIKMPGMSGVDLADEIFKRDFEGGIIFMTGFLGEYSEEMVLSLGIDAYLKKPFGMELLGKITNSVLKKKNLV
ncbi:MAG: response regulator [Candidatus Zixiibacteriota bacterium]